MKTINIALVDDHVILRKSLAVLIELFSDCRIVLQADNGQDFISQLEGAPLIDIVLLDITMPAMSGVETAKWLRRNRPDLKVLALSMLKTDAIIISMLRAGARGYILKECEPSELHEAIREVYHKGYYYNDLAQPGESRRPGPATVLTSQEVAFMQWSCTDKSYKQIAEEMNLSPRTIDGYRDSLFRKLNVSSRVQIAMYAIKIGIVTI